jgi:hypothetical protein
LSENYAITDRQALGHTLAADVLRSSGELRLCVTGTSMLPSIWPGDVVRIQAAATAEPGEVLLFRRNERLFLHRVIGRDGRKLITQGDTHKVPDPAVQPHEVLGKAIAIERGTGLSALDPARGLRRGLAVALRWLPLRRAACWASARARGDVQ